MSALFVLFAPPFSELGSESPSLLLPLLHCCRAYYRETLPRLLHLKMEKSEPSERDGLVRPTRLQMAPHAKAGYRASFGLSLFTLTLFNVMAITVAFLNWDTSCEEPLATVLLWYGVAGMAFVAVLLRHFCYFNELGSWPSKQTATVCLLLLIAIFALGVGLIYVTVVTRETCRLTAPILWRWCFAIVLYFALIIVIGLAVPFLRCFCGCVIAPIAYACVGCAESVQVTPPPPSAPTLTPSSPRFVSLLTPEPSHASSDCDKGPGVARDRNTSDEPLRRRFLRWRLWLWTFRPRPWGHGPWGHGLRWFRPRWSWWWPWSR